MNPIFLDSVGLIAMWDRRDQWHIAAKSCFSKLDLQAPRFVSTSYVLLECANHAARRVYRDEVVNVRDQLVVAGTLFEPLSTEVAWAWDEYSRGSAGSATIVDLISFAVMRRVGIRQAFTNDKHFTTAGFEVLF